MQESYNDERKIDEFKPKMRTLESLELLEIDVGNTVVLAKLDGEFTLLSYTRNREKPRMAEETLSRPKNLKQNAKDIR